MKAMVLKGLCNLEERKAPLGFVDLPDPVPEEGEILIKISACGVCHTELDEIEGRTPPPRLPIVPGHQAVGRVVDAGGKASIFKSGDRVGVAWVYSVCEDCIYCRGGRENLCTDFRATGRDVNGGYAQYMIADEGFAYRIPDVYSDLEAAPLLCAGAIGYRSLRLAGLEDGNRLGLIGFGASAHIILKLVRYRYPNTEIFTFARSEKEREFALQLGSVWVGNIDEGSPEKLDSSIDTTPVWRPVVDGLGNLKPGGKLVINAIRKEDADKDHLLDLDYASHLWMEKEVKSVANVTRRDVIEFLEIAAEVPIKPEVEEYSLEEANLALLDLKSRKIRGAKVLKID
jgi:propanol-preferring alcohol dehydrogenase